MRQKKNFQKNPQATTKYEGGLSEMVNHIAIILTDIAIAI